MYRMIAVGIGFTVLLLPAWADERDRLKVGVQPDGRIVVPTNQIIKPAGKQITFPGRLVDLALAEEGKTVVVKNMKSLVFIDVKTGEIKQTLVAPVGLSAFGLLVRSETDTVYVSDSANHVRPASLQSDGTYKWDKAIELNKPKMGVAYPTGMAWDSSSGRLMVASNRGNTIQIIDPDPRGNAPHKILHEIPVGVAPYAIACPSRSSVFVTNWGGDMPKEGDPRSPSSGTDVRVDPRTNVANHGSVSILGLDKESKDTLDKSSRRLLKTIEVGLHPSAIVMDREKRFVYVANAASDTVSVINAHSHRLVETISCRPEARLPFGSGSNALAISDDGTTLYVANGTNNCIAVIRLGSKSTDAAKAPDVSTVLGQIPTGWYPGAVLLSADGKTLIVANVKGHGSVSQPRPVEKGKTSHDHLGSVSLIPVPDEKTLAEYTKQVNENNRLAYSLIGLEKPRPDAKPVVVPQRHGEPSVIKHVIYVIKENRTYDQVLGDMKEGNGDKNLTIFGEDVTPNHHALARQFTLFDNFYCSGVLSADGHQWCNEAYVTDYLEKAFGKFARSYPYEGSDALAFAPTGFLWDNALLARKSFRNYGEFTKSVYNRPVTWTDLYADYKNDTHKVKIDVTPNVKSLAPFTRAGYPGFVMTTPDVYRAKMFIADLKEFEKKGEFPHLTYLYLPCDHTNGTSPGQPTPRAMVADNDLALGQVVEAVSQSKFWAETCIFVVEDDPQNGFDHVDGHRTVALVISPYTKRKYVDSTCYNQTGMVKTIELLLGLPPMNQLDLSATAMRDCFMDKPDLSSFKCVPNQVPLDQLNPPVKQLKGAALDWGKKSLAMDFSDADLCDEDTLNRILWFSVHGEKPYPANFAGKKEED